ncbi:endo-1,3;1,4-beta-D-glucanase-like isoform X2 [Lycium ferocissimum]|uniref:endo-1,3;1,4-beta-D-glucanase-like isoform X2 n=1 Tax=Lycium ferocissimum TaxID=112874 RepID=UPI0028167BA5|nr:endo-1,3;1,4-beta-D-glucanase-like isoform X2 [Lycium ferocissimum]
MSLNCWRLSGVLSVNLLVTSREVVGVTVICVCPVIKLQEVPILSRADPTIQLLLCRTIADKVAAAGYYVVVPDFFFGDPYNEEKSLSPWFELHKPDKGFEDAKQVAAALKDKGISAIGAAGFCWGAKVVIDLAKSDDIQAAVLLHPSLVKVDDFKEVKPPVAILAAEIDHFCPPERIKQYEEILLSKPEVDKFVKIYPSVKHGWTVRYNVEDKKAVQRAEEAHRDMLDWLTKHVKYSEKGSGFSSVRGPRSSM